jgi:hypothetical protein
MKDALAGKCSQPLLELRSRDGRLSPKDDEAIEIFLL